MASAAAVVLMLASTGTSALADPSGKGQPAQNQQDSIRSCTLRPTQRTSPLSEWASCLSVNAKLAKAPAIGEIVSLDFEVVSERAAQGVKVETFLPENLKWATAPEGLSKSTSVAAGQTLAFTGKVTAVAAGAGEIRVKASYPTADGVEATQDLIFLTVGEQGQQSILDIQKAPGDGVTTAIKATPAAAPQANRPVVPVGRQLGASPQATSCVTGGWFYVDHLGVTRPSINMTVEAWEGGTRLTFGVTGWDGRYTLCFANTAAGKNIVVRWVTTNTLWRVRATGTNNDYAYVTGAQFVADGATVDFGNLQPANIAEMRGLHAFDSANDAWAWKPGTCWDTVDTTCRQVIINWSPTSTDGTYYSLGGNDVHLAAIDPDAPVTVVHEIGHAVMDDVYEDAFPAAPSCNPHSIQGATSAGCAWTEGWAEWFPASVYNDPFFRWPGGASLNLETPTWGTGGWGVGDTTEGRVAGALIDLSDFNNEANWDVYGEGAPGNVWFTFTHHVSNNMSQFWGHRAADGFNTADAGGLSSLYQNTIDYAFCNPLGNYADLGRPTPTPHNYCFNTTTIYWSVTAVRPPAGVDYDLTLYDDRNQTVSLGSSAFGGNTVDFMAVDSNRRPLGDYYPRAYVFSGSGNYRVELAQGTDQLGAASSQAVVMGTNDVVVVRDVLLTAGVPVTFQAIAGNGTQDAELFVLSSDANAATWVRSRAQAAASATLGGAGATETITFTPTISGWHGLVLVNKAGSGTYTLTRS